MNEYRIFISAVTSEFGKARDAVAASLRARGCLVKVQSDFRLEGDADTTLRKLHNYIQTCDAVICIMGQQSGAVPPAAAAEPFNYMLPAGIVLASYTQWEFFFARYYKRRWFIHIADSAYLPDIVKSGTAQSELQNEFIKYAVEQQGFDYNRFVDVHQLRADVLQQDWPLKIENAVPELKLSRYVNTLIQQFAKESASYTPLSVQSETGIPLPEVAQAPILLGYERAPDAPEGRRRIVEINARPIADVIRDHASVVIRGDPGSGKSASCRYLVHQACLEWISAASRGSEQRPVPVLIELHRYRMQDKEDSWDTLTRLFASTLRSNGAFDSSSDRLAEYGRLWLEQAAVDQPLILFLDGLNEVAPNFRGPCHDAIDQLVNKLRGSKSKVLITTRRHGFEAYMLGSLRVFDLQPLSPRQITAYMAKRLDCPRSRAAAIYNTLSERLRFQTSNPLHLNLLCEVLRQGEAPPASRAQLFGLFVDGILVKWDEAKPYDFGQRTFPTSSKHRALQALAVSMQTSGRLLSRDEAEREIANARPNDIPAEKVPALLDELCTNHLVRYRHDSIEFIHHAVQEYFCASALLLDWRSYRKARHPASASLPLGLFRVALQDQGWWEPLSIVGGLIGAAELTELLTEVTAHPILGSMIIANSAPGTTTEIDFVRRLKTRLTKQISDTVLFSQVVLWCIAVFMAGLFSTFIWAKLLSFLPLQLILLTLENPLRGISASVAFWISLICAVSIAVFVYRSATAGTARFHDGFLRFRIERYVEPSLLALRYLESESARGAISECMEVVRSSRWVDYALIERVRAYADRSLPDDLWELSELLDQAGMRAIVLAILTHEYDRKLASDLVERLVHRSRLRREAEILLYQAWLSRYGRAREELVPLLQGYILSDDWPYQLKRKVYRAVRQVGVRIERPHGSILHWLRATVALPRRIAGAVANSLFLPLIIVARIGLWGLGSRSIFAITCLNAVKRSLYVMPWLQTRALTIGLFRAYERVGRITDAIEVLDAGLLWHPDDTDLMDLVRSSGVNY